MAMGILGGLNDMVWGGILIPILGVYLYVLAASTRPDTKMVFLLSLLAALPQDKGKPDGEGDSLSENNGDGPPSENRQLAA